MRAYNIKWDADSDEIEFLPDEIDIPENMTREQEISDYITDITGYCHKGFEIQYDF